MYTLMDYMVDHCKYETELTKEEGYTEGSNGRRKRNLTNKGWIFLVNWKYGTQHWITSKDIK